MSHTNTHTYTHTHTFRIYTYICCLFDGGVCNSDYTATKDWMTVNGKV